MKKRATVEIQDIGTYFELDEMGYLVNPASLKKIQKNWLPVINSVVSEYKDNFGSNLVSVYVRGSVAKGEAIEYISDLDTFAYVNTPIEKPNENWRRVFNKKAKQKYPFVNGIELTTISTIGGKNLDLLLNQSVLVFGSEQDKKKLKIGTDLILHAYSIKKRLERSLEALVDESNLDIYGECEWAMKGIVRMGLELVLERSGKYSRDLYPCYKVFSEYYPEKEPEMKKALFLALNPTGNKDETREVISNLGFWLQNEIEKVLHK